MLKESLIENLEAAKYCVYYRKTDEKWGEFKTGGCLGFPSAIILFSIVDTIGSYFRRNDQFKIKIDNEEHSINSDGWEHFKILNSKYFGQSLSLDFIKALYSKFRNYTTHNSVLGKNTRMFLDDMAISPISYQSKAFAKSIDQNNEVMYLLSITEFYKICAFAVAKFIHDIDEVVPKSKQGRNFH